MQYNLQPTEHFLLSYSMQNGWQVEKLKNDEITTTTVPIGLTIKLWEGVCFHSNLKALANKNWWLLIDVDKTIEEFLTQIRIMWMCATQIIGSSGLTALSKNTVSCLSANLFSAVFSYFVFVLLLCLQSTCSYSRSGKDWFTFTAPKWGGISQWTAMEGCLPR